MSWANRHILSVAESNWGEWKCHIELIEQCYFWIYEWNVRVDFRGTEEQVAANLKKADRLVAEITLLKVM